jgi:Electron transfer DM13
MRRLGWKGLVGGVLLLGAAVVAFGWFEVHKLWVDDEVDEAAPVFDSQAEAEPSATTTGASAGAGAGPTPTTAPAPVIETLASGQFVSLDHGTSGDAVVLGDGSPQRFLRITDFSTENGPDVNVYLTTTPPDGEESTFDDDFVDLGDLRGNVGDQNYEIPTDVDLERFHTVVIWCVRFDSAFGAAQLA